MVSLVKVAVETASSTTMLLVVSAFLALAATVVAQDTTVTCPTGWEGFRDACYLFVDDHDQWTTAEMTCRVFGARLLMIGDQTEDDFIKQFLAQRNTDDQVYIGGHDMVTEGNWTWLDGQPMEFTDWAHGQPDAGNHGEDCLTLRKSKSWQWNDKECDSHLQFICKMMDDNLPGIIG